MNVSSSPAWLRALPSGWESQAPKALFRERRDPSAPDDIHLTPSQSFGVIPQAEYMERTGTRVVLNLTGQDSMKRVERDDFIIHLRSFQGGIEHSRVGGKVSTAYTVLAPTGRAHPGYFRWVLKSNGFVQELQTTTNQLRDGQSIKYRDFCKVRLPLPPIHTQRAIADYLDRETAQIDTLIQEQQRLIDLLRERRTAVLADTFASGFASLVPLKHLAHIQTGITLSGDGDPDDPSWPYLRVANVQAGSLDLAEIKTIHVPYESAARSMLQAGDVLMTEGGDIDKLGRGTLWNGEIAEMLHQNHVFAVRQ